MSVEIAKDRPLAQYTTLKIGGPAEYYCEPATIEELKEALNFAVERGLGVVWFGGGSNLLIHDRGVTGLVIRLRRRFSAIAVEKDVVVADAGCWLPSLMKFGCDKGVLDLSFCAGIPGTVGGAVYMNAGTQEGTISEKLAWVDLLDPKTGGQQRRTGGAMRFGYRTSSLQEQDFIVTRAGFRRETGDGREWWSKAKEQVGWRRDRQPKEGRSAGCFFRNPPSVSAGELIDRAGLKGMQAGDAVVSTVHANFLLNKGKATSQDFLSLSKTISRRVLEQTGIRLKPEVRFLGFSPEELEELTD